MATRNITRLRGNRFIAIHSEECQSCVGCGIRTGSVQLPDVHADSVRIRLETTALVSVLFNSLLLPVLLLVTVAITCSVLSLAEPHTIVYSVLAFVTGLAICRRQPGTLIKLDEVT